MYRWYAVTTEHCIFCHLWVIKLFHCKYNILIWQTGNVYIMWFNCQDSRSIHCISPGITVFYLQFNSSGKKYRGQNCPLTSPSIKEVVKLSDWNMGCPQVIIHMICLPLLFACTRSYIVSANGYLLPFVFLSYLSD